MARRTEEELTGTPLGLVYIAGNLPDAQTVERCLTDRGFDYTVTLEPFTTTSVLGGVYTGAFIYVPVAQHQQCRRILESQGFTDTVNVDATDLTEPPHGA
jgi:hypothetical protein